MAERPEEQGARFEEAFCALLEAVIPELGYTFTMKPKIQQSGTLQLGKDVKCAWVNESRQGYVWHFECKSHQADDTRHIRKQEVADKLWDVMRSAERPQCYCLTACAKEFDNWVDETVAWVNKQASTRLWVDFLTPSRGQIRKLLECAPEAYRVTYGDDPPTVNEVERQARLDEFKLWIEDCTQKGRFKCDRAQILNEKIAPHIPDSVSPTAVILNVRHLTYGYAADLEIAGPEVQAIERLLLEHRPSTALALIEQVDQNNLDTEAKAKLLSQKGKALQDLGNFGAASKNHAEAASLSSGVPALRRKILAKALADDVAAAARLVDLAQRDAWADAPFVCIAAQVIAQERTPEEGLAILRSHPADDPLWKRVEAMLCAQATEGIDPLRALGRERPEDVDVAQSLAYALLDEVMPQLSACKNTRLCQDVTLRDLVAECVQAFSGLIELLLPAELDQQRAAAFTNRATLELWQFETTKAEHDCDEAIRLDATDLVALYNRAQARMSSRKHAEGLSDIKSYLDQGGNEAGALPLLCKGLLLTGAPDKALAAALEGRDAGELVAELPSVALIVVIAYHATKDTDKFHEIVQACERSWPDQPLELGMLASVCGDLGEEEKARELFEKARAHEGGCPPVVELLAAEFEAAQECFEEATALLGPYVCPEVDTSFNRLYARCMYSSLRASMEPASELLTFCERFREFHGLDYEITGIEASVLGLLDRLQEAVDLFRQIYAADPTKKDVMVPICLSLIRLGRTEDALEAIDDAIAGAGDNAIATMALAQCYAACGAHDKSVPLAYSALRLGLGNPTLHLAYVNTVHRCPHDAEVLAEPESVEEGVVFQIEVVGEPRWFALASGEEGTLGVMCVGTGNPVAKAALGHKIDEEIEIEYPDGAKAKCRLLHTKNRFVQAFQTCLERFNDAFPGASGLVKFEAADGDLTPFLAQVDKYAEESQRLLELCRANRLPLSMLAKARGTSLLEIWAYIAGSPEEILHCSTNVQQEHDAAMRLLDSSSSLSAEPVAILTAVQLEIGPALAETLAEVVVPQSFLDELTVRETTLVECAETGRTFVMKEGGRHVRYEETPEVIQKQLDFVARVRTFIDQCKVSGRPASTNKLDDLFSKTMRKPTQDAVAIATETGALWSDELGVRSVVCQELGIESACTCQLLWWLRARNAISEDELNGKLITLASMRYRVLHFTGKTVAKSIDDRSFQSNPETNEFLEQLCSSPPQVCARIAANVLYEVWSENIPDEYKSMVLDTVLGALCTRYPATVVGILVREELDRYRSGALIIPAIAKLDAAIVEWYNARGVI